MRQRAQELIDRQVAPNSHRETGYLRTWLKVQLPYSNRPSQIKMHSVSINDPTTEQEGVIKYRLDYQAAPARSVEGFFELNAWRDLLWRLGVIGQDDTRYEGLSYGNVSLRLNGGGFLITGTQTGHLPHLTYEHYSRVLAARPDENYLAAEGPVPPSSEALTHAAVYGADSAVGCVAHGHSPEIWQSAAALQLPCVAASIAYGTPAMARAVAALVCRRPEQGVIVMLGHQDGLLTYGRTPEEASWLMTRCLARAFGLKDYSEIEERSPQ